MREKKRNDSRHSQRWIFGRKQLKTSQTIKHAERKEMDNFKLQSAVVGCAVKRSIVLVAEWNHVFFTHVLVGESRDHSPILNKSSGHNPSQSAFYTQSKSKSDHSEIEKSIKIIIKIKVYTHRSRLPSVSKIDTIIAVYLNSALSERFTVDNFSLSHFAELYFISSRVSGVPSDSLWKRIKSSRRKIIYIWYMKWRKVKNISLFDLKQTSIQSPLRDARKSQWEISLNSII